MAIAVMTAMGSLEFENTTEEDLDMPDNGYLVVTKGGKKVATFVQGFWYGWQEIGSSRILVAKPSPGKIQA